MISQAPIDHTYRLGAHSPQGALPGSFARRLVLAPLIIVFAMWLMRDEPQGIVIEPISEIGTTHGGDLREFVETGAAFEAPDVEPRQLDSLFTVTVLADITDGGQDRRSRGFANARQLQKLLEVPPRRQSRNSLVEPQLLFGQSVSQILRQGLHLKLVDPVWVFETHTRCGQVVDMLKFLAGPLTAATPGLPLCQEASLARAQEGLWRWMDVKKPQSGWLCQVLDERL